MKVMKYNVKENEEENENNEMIMKKKVMKIRK